MAWQARLVGDITAAADRIAATFEFFDDANASAVLWTETFTFAATWTNADMQKAVQARGAQIRTAQARAAALAAAFPPISTVIAIP